MPKNSFSMQPFEAKRGRFESTPSFDEDLLKLCRLGWKRKLDENRKRIPNALRALPRMAQIPASQGQHTRRLGPRGPPLANVGRQIHSPDAVFCPLRSSRLQLCDGPDGRYHPSVARGVWLHPRPVAEALRDLLGSHRLADADGPRPAARKLSRGLESPVRPS